MEENKINEKWAEILQYAREHATGEGMRKGYKWLQDACEEYFNDHEEHVEKRNCAIFRRCFLQRPQPDSVRGSDSQVFQIQRKRL